MIGAPVIDTLSGGNGTSLKLSSQPTPLRALHGHRSAPLGISVGLESPVAFPDPGCLAGTRLSRLGARLASPEAHSVWRQHGH
jgi:hypothetical protein